MKRLAILLTVALAACSGGGSSVPTASTPSMGHTAALTFAMKIPSATTTGALRHRHYVSASTSSVALTVTYAGTTPPAPVSQTFSVTPGSGACPTSGGTTTCTFVLNVPVTSPSTSATLNIVASDASSVAVASASIPVTIDASGANQITATLGGVIASLRTLISPPSVPATPSTSVPVTIEAFDDGGNLIVGAYNDSSGNPVSINLTSSDPTHEPVSPATVSSSSTAPSIAYDGTRTEGAGATITAATASLSSSATLAIVASGTPNSTAYFETSSNTVVSVGIANTGSSTIRTLTTSGTITNPGITVAPDGTVYALVGANTIDVFAPGQTSGGPLYTITDANFSSSAPIRSIAAIRSGTYIDGVLAGGGSSTSATVDTFAKGGVSAAVHAPLYTGSGPVWSVTSSASGNAFVTVYDGSYAQLDTYLARVPSYSSAHGNYLGDLQNEDFNDSALSSMSGYPWFPVPSSGSATANPQLAVDDLDSQVYLYTTNTGVMYGEAADTTYSFALGESGTHPTAVSLPSTGVSTLAYDGAGDLYTFGNGVLTAYQRTSVQSVLSSGGVGPSSSATTSVSGLTLLAGTVGP